MKLKAENKLRILIDIQVFQSERYLNRDIGRCARALVEAIIRNSPTDQFILVVNGMVGNDAARLRREYEAAWPNVTIRVWTAVKPAGFFGSETLRHAAEAIYDAVIADCDPDVVLVTNLFEGFDDDCVTTVSSFPTVVICYDLIPHIFPELYLSDVNVSRWYRSKIDALKRADLVLAISECSTRDLVSYLDIPASRVINISSDVDPQFVPLPVGSSVRNSQARNFGLTRPFLLHTGGIDYQKNVPGLIAAFASLPQEVIDSHQLVIACPASAVEREKLHASATAAGLPRDTLVTTGFVPDETLVELYNTCAAFVFPSWYEGFCAPVLEAMRCGAAVIGANVSSMPEVIGRDDALFDPRSKAEMARMIEKVLTDDKFRQSLRDSAGVQTAQFSWDESARRALAGLRSLVQDRARMAIAEKKILRKPRLAFVSPLPPERSGISTYSAELLPSLAEYYDIDLIVDQAFVAEAIDRVQFPIHDVEWLRNHTDNYDRVLYQVGNSAFHSHMFNLLEEVPGVVVLHDFFLSNVESHLNGKVFTRLLAENHGYAAVIGLNDRTAEHDGMTEAVRVWPVNARALGAAEGVIVHSENSRVLAKKFYDPSTVARWVVVPLLRVPCEISQQGRLDARNKLGIGENEILLCTFGHVTPSKLPLRLIDGLLKSDSAKKLRVIFVGEGDEIGQKIFSKVSHTLLQGRVHITGWAPDELYADYLKAADLAVQLRTDSRGESSAAVLDCQNYGLPVVVNANGSLAVLPKETVLQIPDVFTDIELAAAIDLLVSDGNQRVRIGTAARDLILSKHTPEECARAYQEAIESFYRRPAGGGRNLLARIATFCADHGEEANIAQAVADSLPSGARLRQLLVDVSALAQHDLKTGIQRVVREVLSELLLNPPPGWRVEPVYADIGLGRYRYARRFTCKFLNIPDDWAADSPVDYFPNDLFLGLDLCPDQPLQMRKPLDAMAAVGVRIAFVVYDLLPVLMPQHFPNSTATFEEWLRGIARHDQLICISRSVADEVQTYLEEHCSEDGLVPMVSWFHLGADITSASTPSSASHGAKRGRHDSSMTPSFLMVGTIEPRKGHALVLDAFELFWQRGGDAKLVIVGKQGWLVEELTLRLQRHAERGRRLIWRDQASDADLEELYGTCSCLIAASEGEGFGLPLVEAARHDLPIIARDIPVFHEVAGENATYFDGKNPESLCLTLQIWLESFRDGKVPNSGLIKFLTWRESTQALLGRLLVLTST